MRRRARGRLAAPLGMLLVQLPVLLDQHLVEGEALGADLAALRGLDDRAPRLAQVRAIVELAAAQVRAELAHRLADLVLGEVEEPERLEARRVDDRRVAIEPVEAREGRGVRAAVERGGEVATRATSFIRSAFTVRDFPIPLWPTSREKLRSRCGRSGAGSNLADIEITV